MDRTAPGTEHITLSAYDAVIINSSAGKDSQTALRHVVRLAKEQGYPLDRLTVSHQDLGEAEWNGTTELVPDHTAVPNTSASLVVLSQRWPHCSLGHSNHRT